MSFTDKESSEAVECLVDSLTIEGTTLSDANLNLHSTELEHLAELSHTEVFNMSSDMEVQGSEEELQTSHEEQVEEEFVQDEIGAHEIEIETDQLQITEETIIQEKVTKAAVPPLRPLTIAPKPAKTLPIQLKPSGGTQLLLLQGGTVGQQIKLLSQTGQELNLSNVSIGKPITIKPAVKTITAAQGGLSMIQPKQVVMKKVISQVPKTVPKTIDTKQGHLLVMQKTDSHSQMKIVQSGVLSGTTKTITLSQAQQMGYLTNAKLVPQVGGAKQTFMINKAQPTKSIKIIPHGKSPTKILPAPQSAAAPKLPQRIFLKPTGASPLLGSNQLIQVSGTQPIGSTGQLHQINIPGKGVQYIKFIQAPQAETSTTVSNVTTIKAQPTSVTNKLIPVSTISSPTKSAGSVMLSEIKKIPKSNLIAPKPMKTSNTMTNASGNQLLVATTYATPTTTSKLTVPIRSSNKPSGPLESPGHSESANLESNGMRPRKPCNCTKSQCLKLYCDCFANGEFCYMCNCMNCFNNLENEEHRQRAIKNCLERNPNAFRPKIGKAKDTVGDSSIRKHTKGCNCKRSGCLKNYCECYEAKIACSSNCKCIGCRNIEDTMEKKNIKPIASLDAGSVNPQPMPSYTVGTDPLSQMRSRKPSNTKQAFNYITTPVIEATATCLLALCNNDEMIDDEEYKMKHILEEFGRCLEEIINCSQNNQSRGADA